MKDEKGIFVWIKEAFANVLHGLSWFVFSFLRTVFPINAAIRLYRVGLYDRRRPGGK